MTIETGNVVCVIVSLVTWSKERRASMSFATSVRARMKSRTSVVGHEELLLEHGSKTYEG